MPSLTEVLKNSMPRNKVRDRADAYLDYHGEGSGGTVDDRKRDYTTMVNHYYDLATDFYEFGWGQSFHFAPRHKGESLPASIARHEMYLAHRLGLEAGQQCLDIGCGVGGPMRTIARFSGAEVLGINNNAYQIERGRSQVADAGLSNLCSFMKSDFMNIDRPSESFDAAYAIEATCHAPDKVGCFSEIYRLLKPGASFCGYEWCLTSKFDRDRAEHRSIKKEIEEGNGLPDLSFTHEVDEALSAAGFEDIESRDAAVDSDDGFPWYLPLTGKSLSVSSIRASKVGRVFTHRAVTLLEKMRVAPKGSVTVHEFLITAADGLVAGGELGIFTPMYFFKATKPAGTGD
jgi:sterol 24-C-methyltransferase